MLKSGLKGVIRKKLPFTIEFYDSANKKFLEVGFNNPNFNTSEVEKNTDYYTTISEIAKKPVWPQVTGQYTPQTCFLIMFEDRFYYYTPHS